MRWIPILLCFLTLPSCILVSKTEKTSPEPSKAEAGLRAELKAARERNDELSATLAAYRKLYGLLPEDKAGAEPARYGIAALNHDLNLVVISLPPGHSVEVGRRLRLKGGGTIVVTEVNERFAMGSMVEERSWKDAKVGDPTELVLPPVEEKPPEPRDTGRSGKTGTVPKIDAKVAAVNPELNIFVISAGRDVGVEPGYEFTVFRGNEYVARIVIEKVESDFWSGYSKKAIEKSPIRVGDDATTRF